MKIAIYGLAKTGTSALYYKVKDALEPAVDGYFEPAAKAPWMARARRALAVAGLRQPRALVAKFLPFEDDSWDIVEALKPFDREILLVRDPRDRFVSAILYIVYHLELVRDEVAARALIALFEAKEADPGSVSLVDILKMLLSVTGTDMSGWMAIYTVRSIHAPMAFHDANPAIHVMSYEDLVDHRYAKLSSYLGVTLTGPAEVAPVTQRVVRTKSYGDWSNWFTATDVACLAPTLEPYLQRYYPGARWDATNAKVLPAATGSAYVARLMNESRRNLGLALLDLDSVP